jgi:hypothetical protein
MPRNRSNAVVVCHPVTVPLVRSAARWVALCLLAAVIPGCVAAGPSIPPTTAPTARPTPTPVTVSVATPGDAAALVIATNPLFSGAGPEDPNVIGASKWWVAEPLPDGGYEIRVTVGWGDCMAGCIERHVWTYEVTPAGTVELISDEGDPVPSDLPG